MYSIRNRAATPIVAALALLGCTESEPLLPSSFGDDGTFTTFTAAAAPGCPAVNPKTVLVDATRDGGVWWFPQPTSSGGFKADSAHQGKALADYFRAQGHTVVELGRGQTMVADSMMTFPVVIRAAYYYDAKLNPRYSDGDLAAYAAFVACPRTLLLFGEFLRDGRDDGLATALGIPLSGIVTDTIKTFSAHAITQGVNPFRYIAGSTAAADSNPNIHVLGRLGTGQVAMGLLNGKAAKVFFIGDMNGIQLMPQPLVANLVAWGFD